VYVIAVANIIAKKSVQNVWIVMNAIVSVVVNAINRTIKNRIINAHKSTINRNNMSTGKLKWFNAKKGYGFITDGETNKDIFLHISDLQASGIESLQEGEDLSFDMGENRGKEKAVNVKQLGGEAPVEATEPTESN
jgi:CspA family cold shock protein